MMMIVSVEAINVEALQTKYPIIDWEVYIDERSRKYWKIIRVRNHTEVYQYFVDMLKRLFEPDNDDTLWKLQRDMHDPLTWRLYDTCGVHHVSSVRGHDIYMLVEKDYPLSYVVLTLMLIAKLMVNEESEMANEFFKVVNPSTTQSIKEVDSAYSLIYTQSFYHCYFIFIQGTQSNSFAGTKASDNADLKSSHDDRSKPSSDDGKKVDKDPRKDSECKDQKKEDNVNSTNNVNTAGNVNTISSTVNAVGTNEVNAVGGKTSIKLPFDPNMPALEDHSIFYFSRDDEDDDAVADMNNLDTTIQVSPNPTTRIHKDHPLDQMDVKSDFLYRKIEEEVYVCQPLGFEDPDFPDRVYKVEKALYGLHQAPRAWYETLSTYLLDNGFQRGKINKTLFIKRHKGDILLMSSMGELTFFLGLQVKQKKDGIFISLDKYVAKILKKFGFTEVKTTSTPMETQKPLLKDESGTEVDVHMYRSMIGSLMYLTSSRPDIMFAVCACARYQVNPKVSHIHVVKRIFRYLKGQPKLGLWYPKDSLFNLVAYTGASLDRKSTT
ncbi:uncharacterized mitochondrial protein-like protein [Tanacetum coccineum]